MAKSAPSKTTPNKTMSKSNQYFKDKPYLKTGVIAAVSVFLVFGLLILFLMLFTIVTDSPIVIKNSCMVKGKIYAVGTTFIPDGCNTCSCTTGGVECTLRDCGNTNQ